MSADYHAFDGDDTYSVVVEGIEAVANCTKRMRARVGVLQKRNATPALKQQVEADHRTGQDKIAEVKAELRGADRDERLGQAEREFRNVCTDFKEAYAEYKKVLAHGPRINNSGNDDSNRGNELAATASDSWGRSASDQELILESDDVDAIMARENREDALRLAKDASTIRETMLDINELIEEDGEQLMNIDQEMEEAADNAEEAAQELTKAREHQKSTMRLKIGIGICCGVTLIVGLFILLWQLGVFNK